MKETNRFLKGLYDAIQEHSKEVEQEKKAHMKLCGKTEGDCDEIWDLLHCRRGESGTVVEPL